MTNQYFSLKEARLLLPKIRSITHDYYQKLSCLKLKIHDAFSFDFNLQAQTLIQKWAFEVTKSGVIPKGSWIVDFDSGDGFYYCWCYDEKDILYFHLYETGFSGRRPISILED